LFQATMAKAQTAKKYTGALDGVESKVDANNFDSVHFTNTLYDSAPLRMTFQAKTRRQAEQGQARLRPKIAELVGGFPEKRAPLEAQTLEIRDFPREGQHLPDRCEQGEFRAGEKGLCGVRRRIAHGAGDVRRSAQLLGQARA
jgi:hypothetical protein